MIRNIKQLCCMTAIVGMVTVPALNGQPLHSHSPRAIPPKSAPFQPLKWDMLPPWMTLQMELRGRTEDQTAYNYISGNGRVYELTRVRGSVTMRPASWFTGYVQFHDTHALGLPLHEVAANMRDTFDFRQGYANFHYRAAQLIVGRQLLIFGDQRVVGISNWTNNSRSWDGADLRIGKKNRIDLFTTSVVTVHPTSLDTHGAGLTFHGVEGNINTLVRGTSLQPFVLIRREPLVTSQQKIKGAENEVTPGIYFSSKLPYHFDASGTGDFQRGSYSNDSIHAGAAIIRGGYTLARSSWAPHLVLEYKYATGNSHRNPDRISTYDQQYPSNHNAFGLTDLFGFRNIKERRASLSLLPMRSAFVLLQAESLHVASVMDDVYSGSGSASVKPPMMGFASDDIGTEFDASGRYLFKKHFLLQAGQGHFFPGALMTHNQHGAPLTLMYFQVGYRYSVHH
ncbi:MULTISPECIES: alginate export family protein [Acidobacterium]|nr:MULTISPECIES: alginate export family protein [Acidobacterium]